MVFVGSGSASFDTNPDSANFFLYGFGSATLFTRYLYLFYILVAHRWVPEFFRLSVDWLILVGDAVEGVEFNP